MHLEQKFPLLDQLYHLHDQYTRTIDAVCHKTCCDCCTCNVTVTTLEAHRMLQVLPDDQRPHILEILTKYLDHPRFTPKATFNQIADLCASGMEPPEETIEASWGTCPLLADRLCPVYDARPFGCRCLVSATPCAQTGAAEMSEFTASVNTLFLQVIEHMDQDGFSGNLSDVLVYALSEETNRPPHLISNTPLRTLLIPPEHRNRITPILDRIKALSI
jgi:hypothetical protein